MLTRRCASRPGDLRPGPGARARALMLVAVLSATLLFVPSLALATQETNPNEQSTETATPEGAPEAEATQTPSPSPLPTITPTATSTRPPKPLTGLVLVPLLVRPTGSEEEIPPDKGLVTGRVLEVSGRGLCGQVVRVSRDGFAQTALTGDDGAYAIGNLEPGTYSVVVEGQISTPANGVHMEGGMAMQVDFTQIKPASALVRPTDTPARTPTPTRSPTVTRTPVPPAAVPAATPTATPGPAATTADITQWWGWLGIDLDISGLVPTCTSA